jgi:hypothetical protein
MRRRPRHRARPSRATPARAHRRRAFLDDPTHLVLIGVEKKHSHRIGTPNALIPDSHPSPSRSSGVSRRSTANLHAQEGEKSTRFLRREPTHNLA